MLWVHTLFDYSKTPPRPLISAISKDGKINIIPLYIPGTGATLSSVNNRLKSIGKMISADESSVNDYKSHIQAFGVVPNEKILCRPEINRLDAITNVDAASKILTDEINAAIAHKAQMWQWVMAESHIVYNALEERGVTDGVDILKPIYSTDTFSGRSKTMNYSIQGKNADDIIMHVDPNYNYFVCFDWIAADIRVASILSKDKAMIDSFIESDPYTVMAKDLGMERDDCKVPFLRTLYSLAVDDPILDYYPTFKTWMRTCLEKLNTDKYLTSILGRRFEINGVDRTDKSVFNAMIQGSVAHAMQRAISLLHRQFPQFLITEVHDSVILACDRSSVSTVIDVGLEIMTHPFVGGLVGEKIVFPTRVSVGREWRKWQKVKEARK